MEYEADGMFSLPGEAESIRGRISFDQVNGGELRLEGLLAAPERDLAAETPIIEGKALDGTALCLLDTFPIAINIGYPEMPVYPHRQRVNRLLVGTSDPREPFESVRISINGLLDFTQPSTLSVTGTSDRSGPISIEWKPPISTPTATVDDIHVALVSEHRFQADEREFGILHLSEVELQGKALPPLDWGPIAGKIEGFIAFCLGYPVWIDRLYFPQGKDRQVDEIYRQRERPDIAAKRPWLTIGELEAWFEEALEGWFGFSVSDSAAFEILNEYLRFGGRLLLEDQMLYLARIIELYHRGNNRFEQVLIPRAEDRERKKAIVGAVPTEYRDWLTGKLARSNEKTLRDRIKELVSSFDSAVEPILGGDLGAFAATATDNRNYFTHYSPQYLKEGKVLEGLELFHLTRRLLFLVRACILREMGRDNATIGHLLARDDWYLRLADAKNA